MNKRYCTLGQYAAKAFFLFAVCGATYSCKDEYKLDDGNPSWLGSSIYEYLESEGNYTNFVKLINDLNYKEVLARTGSKTLFVANDEAFTEFYKNNAWGVGSYKELTKSQKKLLLNSAMINNAYLLEMMSSTPATGSDVNALPNKGQALRRETAASVTDSVPYFPPEELPISYNAKDKDYWKRFRDSGKGIHMALDATTPMMTHFLAAQMANKGITDEDFAIIARQPRDKNDAFIYGSKVIKQDVTCQNGYIDVLDKVFINPQNMAEVLRTNGRTNIFSHMIDRFSAPFYNSDLTNSYRLLYGNDVDSVFQKRYFSTRSQGNRVLNNDAGTDPIGNPGGNAVSYRLNYDPGWNAYADDQGEKEQDMAAIFCPTDEKLIQYFFDVDGGGRFLVKAYAPDYMDKITTSTTDLDLIYQAIDQIPIDVIQSLINNLMKASFNNTVPSKFETIKNSAQDPMFDETDDYHRGKILDVLLANNGVIYLMDEVTTPAEYAAVLAPAYTETDKRIFRYAIKDLTVGSVPLNYSSYLLAMSSRFSFFVPNDDNFLYIDPLSFYAPTVENGTTLVGRAYNYKWDDTKTSNQLTVTSFKYLYDVATQKGTLGDLVSTETNFTTASNNRLKDMLETHTVIHYDNVAGSDIEETQTGMECDKHYFYTKNNAVIYADNATKRQHGMTVKGGWQLDNNMECTVTGFDDKSAQTNGYGNGFAYMIDEPLIPTIESVYSAMYKNPNFSKFFALCQTDNEVLKEIGIEGNDQEKYKIFTNNGGLPCYYYRKDTNGNFTSEFGKIVGSDDSNVRFFNNYRYTIYVPTNEAMEAAEGLGLPTWAQLRDMLELDLDPELRTPLTEDQEAKRNETIKTMVTVIVNFVKYHFQDDCIFDDTPALKKTAYETSTIDSSTGIYSKVSVESAGEGTIQVKDATGKTCHLTSDKNIIARDYITKKQTNPTSNTIVTSSSAVLHGIDNVLNFTDYNKTHRYDTVWKSTDAKKRYFARYRILQ